MQLCSENHPEICYASQYCPLCEAIQEKLELEETAEDLRTQVNNFKDAIDEKEKEIELASAACNGWMEHVRKLEQEHAEMIKDLEDKYVDKQAE